jgi:hypothetical protein
MREARTSRTREYDNMMYVEPLEGVLVSGEVKATSLHPTLIAELDRCMDRMDHRLRVR